MAYDATLRLVAQVLLWGAFSSCGGDNGGDSGLDRLMGGGSWKMTKGYPLLFYVSMHKHDTKLVGQSSPTYSRPAQ